MSLVKGHASSYKKESKLVKIVLVQEVRTSVDDVELKCEQKIERQSKKKDSEIAEFRDLVRVLVSKTQQGFAKSGERFRLLEHKLGSGVGIVQMSERVKKLEQEAA